MTHSSYRQWVGVWAMLCAVLVVGAAGITVHAEPVPTGKPDKYPDWWFSRGVIKCIASVSNPVWPTHYRAAEDFAALNQGQLKALASAAYDEFMQSFPGGAGPDVTDLIKGWYVLDANGAFVLDASGARIPRPGAQNFAAVNLGQLKTVAQPFYDRFIEVGLCPDYPWAVSFDFADSDDFALANLGEAKNLFSFTMTWVDNDDDGLPDWFAAAAGLAPTLANAGAGALAAPAAPNFDDSNVVLGPLALGPNGGTILDDDGVDFATFADGVTLCVRNAYTYTSKNFAFREYAVTDAPRIRYYLVQTQMYMAQSAGDKQSPDQQWTRISTGRTSDRIDPINLKRTYRANGIDSYQDPSGDWTTKWNETDDFQLPARNRPDFSYTETFIRTDSANPDAVSSGDQNATAHFTFVNQNRKKWNGFDFFPDDGRGGFLGSWSGVWDWSSDDQTGTAILQGLPWPTLEADWHMFSDAAGDFGPLAVTPVSSRVAKGRVKPIPPDTSSATLLRVLGKEYTKKDFLRDSKTNQSDYEVFWNQSILGDGSDLAYWRLEETEAELTTMRLRYKFHVKGSRPTSIQWFEVFVPDAANAQPRLALRTWPVPQDQTEHDSPVWEIDPSIRGENGHYLLVPVEFKTYPVSEPGPDKAHKLNLTTRQNEKAFYQNWEKCVSKVWDTSNTVSLIDYLDGGPGNHATFENLVKWKVNGTEQTSHDLSLGSEPGTNSHRHFYIEILPKDGNATIDRLIITLVPRSTKTNFDTWYVAEKADLSWLDELVNLFAGFNTTALPDGHYQRPDRNFDPWLYSEPGAINTRLHPDAYFEARSYQTAGQHGHQMNFDQNGVLLRANAGISAGSADKAAPFPHWIDHRTMDLKPFIWALQLDGSPSDQDSTTLTAPIMHEGAYCAKYYECRPTIANGKPILPDGAIP
jgi:hypothetical protein